MRHSKTYKSHKFVIFKWKTQKASYFWPILSVIELRNQKFILFFHTEPKNKEKYTYTCISKGGKLFFWEKDHIWLFFLSRNLLIIRLLYIITFIWRLVPSCCWQEGGGIHVWISPGHANCQSAWLYSPQLIHFLLNINKLENWSWSCGNKFQYPINAVLNLPGISAGTLHQKYKI